jgi:DNA-binding NarL/FixJ family response regulator
MSANAKTPRPARRQRAILIVDDHPMMREGLVQLISHEKDLRTCGEAGTPHEALEQINGLKPDLVLTDITLPGKSGIELIKDIRVMHPGALILVISMHDEALYVERVLRAGARGYIMKQEGGKKIMEAIRHVLEGKIYVSEKMSAKILEVFSGKRPETSSASIEKLTDREFEVFQLIGKGLSTVQMAQHLHLSPKTIEVHRASIKTKLKIGTASELLRYAVRWLESQAAQ